MAHLFARLHLTSLGAAYVRTVQSWQYAVRRDLAVACFWFFQREQIEISGTFWRHDVEVRAKRSIPAALTHRNEENIPMNLVRMADVTGIDSADGFSLWNRSRVCKSCYTLAPNRTDPH
ncbi:hypothetical protein Bbelb_002490 [Branchiostoma belcheri]|nr:hypothetical protein Bbelb_002490 [Branchiostoma belcheri]